ncbi:hypothetical protein [Actinomadura gamaensis]|uniref:Uncharacterized protein n=1 Tax=Actinomadura gamaensis TaxID=1763541 RepID=A0ABV9U463_9ACTN
MSYDLRLTTLAAKQFNDLLTDEPTYELLMERIIRLQQEPWDAWLVRPKNGLEYRETQFGPHGLLDFHVNEESRTLIILNITWLG